MKRGGNIGETPDSALSPNRGEREGDSDGLSRPMLTWQREKGVVDCGGGCGPLNREKPGFLAVDQGTYCTYNKVRYLPLDRRWWWPGGIGSQRDGILVGHDGKLKQNAGMECGGMDGIPDTPCGVQVTCRVELKPRGRHSGEKGERRGRGSHQGTRARAHHREAARVSGSSSLPSRDAVELRENVLWFQHSASPYR